jgi:hypothetical protein
MQKRGGLTQRARQHIRALRRGHLSEGEKSLLAERKHLL